MRPYIEVISTLLLLVGPAVLGWQVFYWLWYGAWYPLPVSYVLQQLNIPVPDTSWDSFNAVMDSPASLMAFLFSIVLLLAVFEKDTGEKAEAGETRDGR